MLIRKGTKWWLVSAAFAVIAVAVSACRRDGSVREADEPLNPGEVEQATSTYEPMLLRMAGIGGRVELRLSVGADGSVLDARVTQSSGRQEQDSAAVKVAKVARFAPAVAPREQAYVVTFSGKPPE